MINDLAYFAGQAVGVFFFIAIIFAFAIIAGNFILGVFLTFFTYTIFLPYQALKHGYLFIIRKIRIAKRAKYIQRYEK